MNGNLSFSERTVTDTQEGIPEEEEEGEEEEEEEEIHETIFTFEAFEMVSLTSTVVGGRQLVLSSIS